jgi:hypothetical protein
MDVKPCFVAFIDLLGYSARVRAIETEGQVEEVAKDVRIVQKFFGHNPIDKYEKEYHKVADKTVLAFSDCVVVSVSYVSDAVAAGGTFDSPMSELHSLALAQAECVIKGIFLRGGVAFGFWANSENLIVSDAMVEAYELETKACVPVIAVHDDYYIRITNENDRKYYSKDSDPVPKLFKIAFIGKEKIRIRYLNYLWVLLDGVDPQLSKSEKIEYKLANPQRRDELLGAGYTRAHRQCCKEHARLIKAAHSNAANAHIRYKYEWLASYHNEVVTEWYGFPDQKLLVQDLGHLAT